MKKFDINALDLPLDELRRYLDRRPDKIHALDYRKFGNLMNDCFKNTFDCRVEYVDGPNDQGADAFIYLVQSDSPYLVQYKARQSPTPSEGVSVVRDVLGAMVLNGTPHSIVATTREKWSYQAIAAANNSALKQQGFLIELYDCSRILQLIGELKDQDGNPWDWIFKPVVFDLLREDSAERARRGEWPT